MNDLMDRAARLGPTSVLDIGCGPGSFSLGLASRAPVRVLAIDLNPVFLERARSSLRATALAGEVDFVERPLLEDEATRFDLVVCIGSSAAAGSPRQALHRCRQLTRTGGAVVFADLTWRASPHAAFLSFLGVDDTFYWRSADGRRVFEQSGLEVLHECEASDEAWQAYETAVYAGRLRLADALPAEEAERLRHRAATWFDMFERHGRACFGFNAYVARPMGCTRSGQCLRRPGESADSPRIVVPVTVSRSPAPAPPSGRRAVPHREQVPFGQ